MVRGLQLRTAQRLVLAGIFSLAFVDAIFDILRTVESLKSGTFSGVALWSSLEVTIAVIVASLPHYRALLTSNGRKSLLSRSSMGRYKDMSDGQNGVERKRPDGISSRPHQTSIGTFRDDSETQGLASQDQKAHGQHIPLAHLPY